MLSRLSAVPSQNGSCAAPVCGVCLTFPSPFFMFFLGNWTVHEMAKAVIQLLFIPVHDDTASDSGLLLFVLRVSEAGHGASRVLMGWAARRS